MVCHSQPGEAVDSCKLCWSRLSKQALHVQGYLARKKLALLTRTTIRA